MLVLTRKHSESITIGSDVVITVTQIGHGKVNLGIQAPAHVRILRSELSERHAVSTDTAMTCMPREQHDEEPVEPSAPLFFSTDYAAEIEDQMLCLLSH